jgi:hypothetical protein
MTALPTREMCQKISLVTVSTRILHRQTAQTAPCCGIFAEPVQGALCVPLALLSSIANPGFIEGTAKDFLFFLRYTN